MASTGPRDSTTRLKDHFPPEAAARRQRDQLPDQPPGALRILQWTPAPDETIVIGPDTLLRNGGGLGGRRETIGG